MAVIHLSRFRHCWGFILTVTVPTFIIVMFDIGGNVQFTCCETSIASLGHPFRFETSEETLHRGIVPTITASAHTLFDSVAPQTLSKGFAGVVTTLI
jgi:hypothetical protein